MNMMASKACVRPGSRHDLHHKEPMRNRPPPELLASDSCVRLGDFLNRFLVFWLAFLANIPVGRGGSIMCLQHLQNLAPVLRAGRARHGAASPCLQKVAVCELCSSGGGMITD